MVNCPEDGCDGHIEASTKVYLDIDEATIAPDGVVTIEAMSFSHLNDHFEGQACNLEGEFNVSCSDCGREFDWYTSEDPKMADRIGVQPIGDAPRTTGQRGGL